MVSHPRFDLVMAAVARLVKEVADDLDRPSVLETKLEDWRRRNEFHYNFMKAVSPRGLEMLLAVDICKFKQAGTCRVEPIDRGEDITFKKLMVGENETVMNQNEDDAQVTRVEAEKGQSRDRGY